MALSWYDTRIGHTLSSDAMDDAADEQPFRCSPILVVDSRLNESWQIESTPFQIALSFTFFMWMSPDRSFVPAYLVSMEYE
jgi:hypothetical protein